MSDLTQLMTIMPFLCVGVFLAEFFYLRKQEGGGQRAAGYEYITGMLRFRMVKKNTYRAYLLAGDFESIPSLPIRQDENGEYIETDCKTPADAEEYLDKLTAV